MPYRDRYFLNGKDMFLEYGFIPSNGCLDSLMQERETKERYSNDWPEHNGKELDLLAPVVFKERQFKLTGTIKANNYADYAVKIEALKDEIYNGVCEVEGIIGGRNLILDTSWVDRAELSNKWEFPLEIYHDDYWSYVKQGDSYGLQQRFLLKNSVYTVSGLVKSDVLNQPQNVRVLLNDGVLDVFDWHSVVVTSNVWKQFNFSFTLSSEKNARLFFLALGGNHAIKWANLKLEKGTTATDWQPDLKVNALATSIKTNKTVNPTAKPFLMPVEINLMEVFL